jgi:hypothetical protein
MKLWKLYGIKDSGFDWAWDTHFGFVIRAETEERARQLASEAVYWCENGAAWLDPDFTTCEEITGEGEEEVVLKDYNAG